MNPPVVDFYKNESVQQLLEWYNDAKSRKVVHARKQLCRRFEFLSYEEQCSIIEAFMNRGNVSDIVLSCKYLANDAFWKEEYLPLVEKCLDHLILTSEAQLRYVVQEFLIYYNKERPHSGLDGRMIDPWPQDPDGEIRRFTRLGGLLATYRRVKEAA